MRSHLTSSLVAQGLPLSRAARESTQIAQFQSATASLGSIPRFVRLDFADGSRIVFYAMAGIMAAAALVAMIGLHPRLQEEGSEQDVTDGDQAVATGLSDSP